MPGFISIFLNPVPREVRPRLREKWGALSAEFRSLRQMVGRHEEGCGATIGAMPRCDFACKGCYLTRHANRMPACDLDEVKRQIRLLREDLGPGGNLQLTDGELTLRDEEELKEIIRYAWETGLVPMLMTHGDSFRTDPDLLTRLVEEAGLEEISLHIDTTQNGRMDYDDAVRETDLDPLREEFAQRVRDVRTRTGKPLRVAGTVTVTEDILKQTPGILDTMLQHSDVYRMIAFLPAAQVGRTLQGVGGGVSHQELWHNLSRRLDFQAEDWHWYMAHPECSRFVMGFAVHGTGPSVRYLPLSMAANERDKRFLKHFYSRFGGVTFRGATRFQNAFRAAGMAVRAPKLFGWDAPSWAWSLLPRIRSGSRLGTLLQILTGRIRLRRFTVASHHFMNRQELETPLGRERAAQCSFKVPFGDRLVSMCEMNNLGYREQVYEDLRDRKSPEKEKNGEVVHF